MIDNRHNICVILPAYNEAPALGTVLDRLLPIARKHAWEVIVVNDGSADGTAKIGEDHGVRVISHAHNRGYGASLKTGTEATNADIVVFMDSDGQQDENDILRLLEYADRYDMVVGARTDESYVDPRRLLGKRLLCWFAHYLAKETIPDINSGFRAFRRDVLLRYLHLMPQGFSFSTTSTFAMMKGGHKIKWIPIRTDKRIGRSTVKQLRDGPETLVLMLRLAVLFDPMRVFMPISGVLILLAAAVTVLNFALYRRAVPASAVLFGISAVIIFMLGLLTDQVSAIRREQHRRL